ncbi:MAG: DNA repair protein RecN [Bacteroidetes bacterium]|nr:DNA repair protein RecN [Bacteroidota bacterium]MBU1114297.1 DNA repair protein RecN [Bacteroidota bacterium]MBU1799412.1 DNA repair protein RecN [Bacteroidota bacterium]
MLKSLLIKDYALIENINVEFGKGLNIITGETGAGKSILIDAMGLLLGERASTQVVRKGAKKSIVEGIYDVSSNTKVENLLNANDIDYFSELIVRREVSLEGSNRCFLNDTPTSLALLKDIGNMLVDLHGQHEHQSLLRSVTHIDFLDEFAELSSQLKEYKTEHSKLGEIAKELFVLKNKENSLKEERESYEFQIKEIDAISPQPNEEALLKDELNILQNSEKLLSLTEDIYNRAYENEDSVQDNLAKIQSSLIELSKIDNSFSEMVGEADSAIVIINDISDFIRSYKSRVEDDPTKLDEIRERLGALTLLKKRYGGTLEKVIEHRENIGREYDITSNYNEKIIQLENELKAVRKSTGEIAKKISEIRKLVADKIRTDVISSLNDLGISDSDFRVQINNNQANESAANYLIIDEVKYKFNSKGFDEVEFLLSTNLGEDLKPLSKVASGGEISRIMLALKSILAKSDKLPLLIFDEIDTGVSGRIAQKVGATLKSLSQFHQIISITHLPQIASLSDEHFSVEKKKIGTRVVSSIRKLDSEEKINEVAKLLSGEDVTEASLLSAKELMGLN